MDGDGIPYRTIPGTHPSKGSFFTRGTSKTEYAKYTEDGAEYVKNVDRLSKKWETSKELVPPPVLILNEKHIKRGMLFFGTTAFPAKEAWDLLKDDGIRLNAIRIKSIPFNKEVEEFVDHHDEIFVIEQNKDGQMRTVLINELDINPGKLIPILNYDGFPITADTIYQQISAKVGTAVSEL